MSVTFVANHQSAVCQQPTDRAFDLVAAPVAPELAAVLGPRAFTVFAVWTDQIDLPSGQTFSQRVAVGGFIVDQSLWTASRGPLPQQRFDQVDIGFGGTGDVDAQRCSVAIDEEHDLGAFAFLGLANVGAPFFAGENIPSPIVSFQSMCFSPSSFPSSRAGAEPLTPPEKESKS